jgi:Ca2+-transporting ATPase
VWRFPFSNRWLNRAVAWEFVALAGVMFLPGLRKAFGVVSLSVDEWTVVVAVAGSIVPVLELCKAWIRRRWPAP